MSESQQESSTEQDLESLLGTTPLLDRLQIIGEELAPREAFANLTALEFQIWLTEPDPNKFPPGLEHLKQYLPIELGE